MKVTTDSCLFGSWVVGEVKNPKIKNVLDIGTGTGLLSLMLAQRTNFAIDAIELDKIAYEQAKENVAASPWGDRIHVIHADARSYRYSKKYDVIISNPPFYENEIKSNDKKKNISHHSEQLVLKGLLDIIKSNLNVNGSFFLLLPYKRHREIKTIFREQELHIDKIIFVKQSQTHDFFRIMIKGSSPHTNLLETQIDELPIWNEKKEYTTEFTGLLKDYYLNL
jgi:tRNA1Val (adenine37-N6)-methyltransferase